VLVLVLMVVLTVELAVAVAVIVVTCRRNSEASDRGIDSRDGIVRVGRRLVFLRGASSCRDGRRERRARGCGIDESTSADDGRRGGMTPKINGRSDSILYGSRNVHGMFPGCATAGGVVTFENGLIAHLGPSVEMRDVGQTSD